MISQITALTWLVFLRKISSLTHLTFPEVNVDAARAEEAERRLALQPLIKSCLFSSRRKRTQPTPKPGERIIQWYAADIAFRQAEWRIGLAVRTVENGYRLCPKMKRVDYGTLDPELVECNEDQRRHINL